MRHLVCTALWLILASAPGAIAQIGQQGSITGTVSDTQGGALPGVTVVAVQQGTNVTSKAITNESGVFLLTSLAAASYRVTFTMPQFKTVAREIEVRAGDRLRLDQSLALGALGETVQVVAGTPLLETESATRSTVINQEQIEALPINGRNVFTLVHLTPGVLDDGSLRPSISRRPFDNGGMDSFSINGGVQRSNAFLLEGAANTANEGNNSGSLAFVPPPEAVQEVRVSSNVYDAQFGRTGGGVVSVSVRSGTNQLNGSASYLYRSAALTAPLYQSRDLPKSPIYHQNPSFTIGGPVVLPKYNGRDKTFFFGSYEGLKSMIEAGANLSRAPSALESACLVGNNPCDFSQSGLTGPLINPFTRLPVANNQIPASLVDPVSRSVFAYMRRANSDPDASLNNFRPDPSLDGGFYPSTSRGDVYHSFLGKVSQNISDHRMFVTFGYNRRHELRAKNGLNEETATGSPHHYRWNYNTAFDWTTPLGPTMVSTFKAGWVQHSRRDGLNSEFDSSQLGLSSAYLSLIPREGFFQPFTVDGYGSASVGSGDSGNYSKSNLFTISQLFTKIWGRHQFKFGGEYGRNWDDQQVGAPGGAQINAMAFTRHYTSNTPTVNTLTAAAGGNSFASFLFGVPRTNSIELSAAPLVFWNASYAGAYFQDDWRISNRLTVNLGLRWDYEQAVSERDNLVVDQFAATTPNPLACPLCPAAAARPDIAGNRPDGGAALANLIGGPVFTDGRIYNSDWNNVGPRVGLTYQITEKLIARGGYGLTYLSGLTNRGTLAGVTRTTSMVASNNNGLTPATNLSETIGPLYPTGLLQPIGRSQGLMTNIGANVGYDNRDRELQAYHTWNAGYQFELPWRSKIDMNYVGSQTRNRPITLQMNDLTLEQLALGSAYLDELVPNPFVGLLPGTNFNAATIQRRQLLRPFPEFNNVSTGGNPLGGIYYNALQTTWDKRLSQGVSLLLSYTFSRNEQLGAPLNQGDPLYRQLTQDHRPHLFRISGTWNTPSLERHSGLVHHLLGDWQVSGVTAWSQGRTIGMPGNVDLIGDPVLDNPTKQRWFNTCTVAADGLVRSFCASETEAPAFQLRPNNARDTTGDRLEGVYAHSPMLLDFTFSKTIRGPHEVNYQVRVDLFNLFNTVQWGSPETNVTNTAFGTVNDNQSNDARFTMLTFKVLF